MKLTGLPRLKYILICAFTCLFLMQPENAKAQSPDLQYRNKEELKEAFAHDDSAKAVINLFYRKRKGAMWRGIIGGSFAGYSAGAALSSGDASSAWIGPVVISPLWITSITSFNKYKQSTLVYILSDRDQGGRIPARYRKKLKAKDF